jgi:hypothetical protein
MSEVITPVADRMTMQLGSRQILVTVVCASLCPEIMQSQVGGRVRRRQCLGVGPDHDAARPVY